jgi:hypothetical protein
MNICTIIAKNYIAHARVLAQSHKEHHPEGTCYVLVIDDTEGYIDASLEPFELVTPAAYSGSLTSTRISASTRGWTR